MSGSRQVPIPPSIKLLIESADYPPGEGVPAGAAEEQILRFERNWAVIVPDDLRSLLMACNGPCIGAGGIAGLSTIRKSQDIEIILDNFPTWKQQGWIPVAGDGNGNYYLIRADKNGNPIVFMDVMSDTECPSYVVSSNLWRFLNFYLSKDKGAQSGWPFHRAFVIANDPEIIEYSEWRLPWEN